MAQRPTSNPRLAALGGFFRFYRRERHRNQEDLADEVGVNKNTISQIERGRQWPSMPVYLGLLDALRLAQFDVTNQIATDTDFRRSTVVREMGLEGWFASLSDDEMRYAFVRAWEGIELMREMERRGLDHPFRRYHRTPKPLDLLAPEEIDGRIQRSMRALR